MDYNKLKDLLTAKKISIPTLAKEIGMSKAGLYLAISNERLTVDIFEKICTVIKVPITELITINELFPENSKFSELEATNKLLENKIQVLQDQLDDKQRILRLIDDKLSEILKEVVNDKDEYNYFLSPILIGEIARLLMKSEEITKSDLQEAKNRAVIISKNMKYWKEHPEEYKELEKLAKIKHD